MKKTHLYVLASAVMLLALAAIYYKWAVLKFPLQPDAQVEVWTVQARVQYTARSGPSSVTLQLPSAVPGWTVLEQRYVGRNYSRLEQPYGLADALGPGREVQWNTRRAVGDQSLYYRATVVRADRHQEDAPLAFSPEIGALVELEEPYRTAAETLLDQVRDRSSNTETLARELVRRFSEQPASEEVALLADLYQHEEQRSVFIARLLETRNLPTRIVHGLRLSEDDGARQMQPWLVVYTGTEWVPINPRDASTGFPPDFFIWSARQAPLLAIEGAPPSTLEFTATRNLADAMAIAERRLEVQDANLVAYSLLSLPLQAQETYRILLMVPVGAFIMLLLRNLVGVKTFGTFMPVLVALAFRTTSVGAGIAMFVLIVGAGLLVRFYLERLRLLLVPRLTAILILVVMLMALVSVMSNRLGIEIGLSVALFPMVIMAMTIERMSVAWDERGAGAAIKDAVGTLIVATLAYVVMAWPPLEHLVFVFPEVLLLLFAFSLLLGRYSGYRLTELFRFRALARDPDPIAPAPIAPAPDAKAPAAAKDA